MKEWGLAAATAVAASAWAGSPAGAALLRIESLGGPAHAVGSIAGNDVLPGNVSEGGATLSYGRLEVGRARADVTHRFLGAESGFTNTLTTRGGAFAEDDRILSIEAAVASDPRMMDRDVGAGALAMSFAAGGRPIASNANNAADGSPGVMFGYLADKGGTWSLVAHATNRVLVALDDGGAGGDRDFDDYVGIVHATPVPAAAPLLAAGLGAMAFLRRRRSSRRPEA